MDQNIVFFQLYCDYAWTCISDSYPVIWVCQEITSSREKGSKSGVESPQESYGDKRYHLKGNFP